MTNDVLKYGLQGNVKSVTEVDYSNFGKYTSIMKFDENGMIQTQSSFNPDGSLIKRWQYEYNSQLQKIKRYCYVLNDSLSGIVHYNYSSTNQVIEEFFFGDKGNLISRTKNKYDNYKNLTETISADKDSAILVSVICKYDASNKLIEEVHFDSIMHKKWKQIYTYNSDGLNTEILFQSLDGVNIKKSTYSYLSNKLVGVFCQFNNKNQLVLKTTYEYNDKKNFTRKQVVDYLNKTDQIHTYVYKCDKHENWVFRYEYINNKIEDVISRTFEYY